MRLHIYSLKKETYELFLSFIDSNMPFKPNWYPLNENKPILEEPHFSIFLLSVQSANSIWLKERIKKLKELGAHDRNFYFILHDKEVTPKSSDIKLVIEDLNENLSEVIANPIITPISIKAHDAFRNNAARFLYFDNVLNEHRTIKQLEIGDADDFLHFQNYIGKNTVNSVLEEWIKSPYLLFWKKPNLTTVLVFDVPVIIVDKLQTYYTINVMVASSKEEFLTLQQDKEIISITTDRYLKAGENLLPNQFIISKGHIPASENSLYFDEEVYALTKLPLMNLQEREELVFLDTKGYPKPKSKIKNWQVEIEKLAGLETVINRVGAYIL